MARRSSFAGAPRASFPVSPGASRSRASSIFPYSLAREPSGYSAQSWIPPPLPVPIPSRPLPPATTRYPDREQNNPFDQPEAEDTDDAYGGVIGSAYDGGTEDGSDVYGGHGDVYAEEEGGLEIDEGGGDTRETPLYARSDWGDAAPTATSAWSRSSFAGMTTALPTAKTRLGYIEEESAESGTEARAKPPVAKRKASKKRTKSQKKARGRLGRSASRGEGQGSRVLGAGADTDTEAAAAGMGDTGLQVEVEDGDSNAPLPRGILETGPDSFLAYDEPEPMTAPLTSANGPTDPRYRVRTSLPAVSAPASASFYGRGSALGSASAYEGARQRSTFHAQPTPGWPPLDPQQQPSSARQLYPPQQLYSEQPPSDSYFQRQDHQQKGYSSYPDAGLDADFAAGRDTDPFSESHAVNGFGGRSARGASPNLMVPEEHQRLGRMSVAPARYSLPAPRLRPRSLGTLSSPEEKSRNWLDGPVVQSYLTYRPFVVPAICLTAALVSTLTLQTAQGGLSAIVRVPEGAFQVNAAAGAAQLGLWGWCGIGATANCRGYMLGDFATSDNKYSIPGSSKLSALSYLVVAQTIFAWYLAVHTLVSAFLHFYLLFSLSVPFDRFASISTHDERVQAEVDLRVRCERFADVGTDPDMDAGADGQRGIGSNGYVWAWWAWWGFRRGPVACAFSVLVFVLGLAGFATAIELKSEIETGTDTDGVTYGTGAFVPLIGLVLNVDPLVSTAHDLVTFARTWRTFVDPPEPSAAALLLPASVAPLQHTRASTGETFYRPRTALPDPLAPPLPYSDPAATAALMAGLETGIPNPNPNHGPDLDPETRRWLAAYPSDPELVPLLADLRAGKPNDDFLLSDVGLLYLRPDPPDLDGNGQGQGQGQGQGKGQARGAGQGNEQALLVPPAGVIRDEILEDMHVAEDGSHSRFEEMVSRINEVFWWTTVEEDCLAFVSKCGVCASGGGLGTSLGRDAAGPRGYGDEAGRMSMAYGGNEKTLSMAYGGDEKRLSMAYGGYGVGGKQGKGQTTAPAQTAVPFTGVTGWTDDMAGYTGYTAGESKMAAEMAVAMRKAEEDAERDRLLLR